MTSKAEIKQLRTIGHKLKPVVTIAGNGLSETVTAELERALNDHELIKIKLAVGAKAAREATLQAVCDATQAQVIQAIGNTALILRHAKKPDPKLSNLSKPVS